MISREQIEEIIAANDIVDVISEYVELHKRGANYIGRCPFHNEKTPSFSVSREKNIYHCFGCHEHGNVVGFLMNFENLSYPEALEALANRAGITIKKEAYKNNKLIDDLYKIYEIANSYYINSIKDPKNKRAFEYAMKRGLSGEIAEKFQIGYAPAFSELYNKLKENKFGDEIILKSGLFSKYNNKIIDKFYNRLMFPIMDLKSRVVAFGGRNLGEKGPKYLNSPETEIFKKSKIIYGLNFVRRKKPKFLILCEGYMDVITMHKYGFDMSVATLGTACNENHIFELKKVSEKIFLMYDSDEAGRKAIEKAAGLMAKHRMSSKVVSLSPYKDPDEALKEKGQLYVKKALEKSIYSYQYCADRERIKYNFNDPNEKTIFTEKLAEILANYPKDVAINFYKDLASKYQVSEDLLRKYLGIKQEKFDTLLDKEEEKLRNEKDQNKGKNKLERMILSLLTNSKYYLNIRPFIREEYFATELYRQVLKEIDDVYERHKSIGEIDLTIKFDTVEIQQDVAGIYADGEKLNELALSDYQTVCVDCINRLIEEYYDRIYDTMDALENRKQLEETKKGVNISLE